MVQENDLNTLSDLLYLNMISLDINTFKYNFTNYNMFFNNIDLNSTDLYNTSAKLVNNIANYTLIKNDAIKTHHFLPDYDTEKNLSDLEL
jgi:hypothetical protein